MASFCSTPTCGSPSQEWVQVESEGSGTIGSTQAPVDQGAVFEVPLTQPFSLSSSWYLYISISICLYLYPISISTYLHIYIPIYLYLYISIYLNYISISIYLFVVTLESLASRLGAWMPGGPARPGGDRLLSSAGGRDALQGGASPDR